MVIKSQPTDFIVDEVLSDEAQAALLTTLPDDRDPKALHALYLLRKSGVSTPDAVREIGRRLRVPPTMIGIAGFKDRHAQTSQHLSLPLLAGLRGGGPRTLDHRGWRLERLGWLPRPMTASMARGNRFSIVVRGLGERESRRMTALAARLEVAPGSLLFVNYFGDQRFGGAEKRRDLLGPLLVRGEFEQALKLAMASPHRKDARGPKAIRRAIADGWGKWAALAASLPPCPERRAVEHLDRAPRDFPGAYARLPIHLRTMAVEAYQSLLWNAVAVSMITERFGEEEQVFVAKDPWGELPFPKASLVTGELRSSSIPLLSPSTALQEPWGSAATRVLRDEGLGLDDLRVPAGEPAGTQPTFHHSDRPLFAVAEEFELSPLSAANASVGGAAPDRSGTRRVTFMLPRGAYATVLLRALGQ